MERHLKKGTRPSQVGELNVWDGMLTLKKKVKDYKNGSEDDDNRGTSSSDDGTWWLGLLSHAVAIIAMDFDKASGNPTNLVSITGSDTNPLAWANIGGPTYQTFF